jgi:hypothetical protein
MPTYTVQDTQTGKKVRFEWNDHNPPTDKDMTEVFAQARSIPIATPPPTAQEEALQPGFKVPDFIKASAIPTAGSMAGGAIGTAIGGPGAGSVVGQAIGSGAGEIANQMLGITEPSLKAIAISAATPIAVGAALGAGRSLLRTIGKRLPGASIVQHGEAIKQAKDLPNIIQTVESGPLYDVLKTQNPAVSVRNLSNQADELVSREAQIVQGLKNPTINTISQELQGASKTGAMSFQDLWANLQRIGQRVGATRAAGGEEHGAYKQLYSAIWKDLDNAASNVPGSTGAILKEANRAYRKEIARADLAEIIKKSISPQAGTGYEYIQPKQILKWLDKSKDSEFFRKSLDPAEFHQIKTVLNEMIKIRPLMPPPGANFGSGRVLARTALGGAVGGAATGSPQGAIAAAAIMAEGPEIIARAITTKLGRKALVSIMSGGFTMDYPKLAALAQVVYGTQKNINTEKPAFLTVDELIKQNVEANP